MSSLENYIFVEPVIHIQSVYGKYNNYVFDLELNLSEYSINFKFFTPDSILLNLSSLLHPEKVTLIPGSNFSSIGLLLDEQDSTVLPVLDPAQVFIAKKCFIPTCYYTADLIHNIKGNRVQVFGGGLQNNFSAEGIA